MKDPLQRRKTNVLASPPHIYKWMGRATLAWLQTQFYHFVSEEEHNSLRRTSNKALLPQKREISAH